MKIYNPRGYFQSITIDFHEPFTNDCSSSGATNMLSIFFWNKFQVFKEGFLSKLYSDKSFSITALNQNRSLTHRNLQISILQFQPTHLYRPAALINEMLWATILTQLSKLIIFIRRSEIQWILMIPQARDPDNVEKFLYRSTNCRIKKNWFELFHGSPFVALIFIEIVTMRGLVEWK